MLKEIRYDKNLFFPSYLWFDTQWWKNSWSFFYSTFYNIPTCLQIIIEHLLYARNYSRLLMWTKYANPWPHKSYIMVKRKTDESLVREILEQRLKEVEVREYAMQGKVYEWVSEGENNLWSLRDNMGLDPEDLIVHFKGSELFSEWGEKLLECLKWWVIWYNFFSLLLRCNLHTSLCNFNLYSIMVRFTLWCDCCSKFN